MAGKFKEWGADMSKEKMSIEKIAIEYGYCGLFATPENTQECYNSLMDYLNDNVKPADRIRIITGIHMLINSYAIQCAELDKSK